MNFELNDEQAALSATLARFVADRYEPPKRDSYAALPQAHDPAVWRELAELGLVALTLPEEDGGLGAGAVELSVALEALGPGLLLDPWLPAIVAGRLIASLGTAAQKDRWLPGIAAGEAVIGLAFDEPGLDHPLARIAAAAHVSGDGHALTGRKVAALGGQADAWLVLVHDEASGGASLYLVPSDTPGLSVREWRLADGSAASDIMIEDARLGADALLGEQGKAREAVEDALGIAYVALCAEAVGIMDAAISRTIEYLQLRKQFGVPLSTFQVIQHRMADCAAEFELAKGLVMKAAMEADDRSLSRDRKLLSAFGAKAFVSRAARRIAEEMVQFHGAIGITEELWIGRAMKRLLVIGGLFGDERAHTAYGEGFRERERG